MKKNLLATLVIIFSIISLSIKSQAPLNYVFTQDSLNGYNEQSSMDIASHKHLVGKEYKFYMYNSKREYINHKYHLGHASNFVWKTLQTATVQPGCSNVDFESGNLTGWTVSSGSNSNSLSMATMSE